MIKEVFPKRIDRKTAQFELKRLVDAFLCLAEDELARGKAAKEAPTRNINAGKCFDSPLTSPLTLNGKTR